MKKAVKWLMISVLIAIPILLIVGCVLFFFPNPRFHFSRSLEDYEACLQRSYWSEGVLFPERSLLTEENCVFYDRFFSDGANSPEYLSYALCTFSEEDYERQVARLAELSNEYSEEYFSKPAYILCLNAVGLTEYALVDEGRHSIHYYSMGTKRYYDQISAEDRIKPEYADLVVYSGYEIGGSALTEN
ncbi:MAG: hypothetical protein K6C33_12045 [Desulfovibrio sp.]|nr:hypothetical protein [Desulfovibrio sp.]